VGATMSNGIPIEELEELVETWRYTIYTNHDEQTTRSECANELQDVIQDYE